jgi:nicotinamide-nucleotide amidase
MNVTPIELAAQVGALLQRRGLSLVTAESCTGGWIAKIVTDIPGSSAWFERGLIVYSDASKQELLDVRESTLAQFGAVSAETVAEMALGALHHSHARLAVAVSGVAGPGGGSPAKPVGTVYLAWALDDNIVTRRTVFNGDRNSIRQQAVNAALQGVLEVLGE